MPSDTTAVINVAGVNILNPMNRWNDEFKKDVWNSRVDTTKILANAVRNSDVKYFGQISGVAYYKPDDKEYTENDKCEKYDYLSGTKTFYFILFYFLIYFLFVFFVELILFL